MRKKYLSALLFGALLVTSAGTFTSCKDYDDDINNLQEQITANADAIKKLQEMIGDGKFVTNITSENNGLKITWNDGQSTVIENVINGEDQKGDVVTIDSETGEIKINNEGTGFFASKGQVEEGKLPFVNEEGILVLIDEEGKEVVTGIRVSPVTAVVNEDGSAVLTIIGADGKTQTINVPSAASMITDLVVSGDVNGVVSLAFDHYKFNLADNNAIRKTWDGAKTLPAAGTNIVRTKEPDKFGLRINPITIDATGIDFTLVNSANNALPGIKVIADANNTPLAGADTRAAAKGGIYDLTVEDLLLDKNADMDEWASNLNNSSKENINFALTANGGVRSEYNIQGKYTYYQTNLLIPALLIKNGTKTVDNSKTSTVANVELDRNVTYKLTTENNEAIYDMMISADKEAISNYGLVIDKENYTIKVSKDADVSTEGKFKFTVTYITIDGAYKTVTYNVELSNKINKPAEYAEISHAIKTTANQNFFAIDLATMKEAMSAEELNTWKTRVDLGQTDYKVYNKKADGSVDTASEVSNVIDNTGKLLNALVSDKNTYTAKPATEKDKANYVVVKVDNNKAGTLNLFTTYYVAVTFNTTAGDEINTIYVPVKFTAPTVAEQYKVKSGLEKDGVVYGFFNTQRAGYATAEYTIVEAFSEYAKDANYVATTDLIEGTQIKSNDTNKGVSVSSSAGDNTTVKFAQQIPDGVNKVQDAYNKAFTINASKDKYEGWKYINDSQKNYTFKMKLLSPIFSGTFAANGTIEVNGGQAYTITNAQLNVKDYNNTPVNILHDAIKEGEKPTATWSDKRVYEVKAVGVSGQLQDAAVIAGKVDAEGKLTEGTISGRANSVATDAESKITITVKDIFGYVKSFELPVTVKANR